MTSSFKIKLIIFASMLWLVAGATANRFGYLMTDSAFNIRAYGIFPALFFCWYLWIFWFRWGAQWNPDGKRLTIHEVNLQKSQGRWNRLKMIFVYAIGFPVLLAWFAWLTIGIPAWLARFTADEPFAHEYLYTPGAFIASGYKFKDMVTGDNASVRVTAALYKNFPDELSAVYAGKVVCLQGRTSIFGTIVQEIKPGSC